MSSSRETVAAATARPLLWRACGCSNCGRPGADRAPWAPPYRPFAGSFGTPGADALACHRRSLRWWPHPAPQIGSYAMADLVVCDALHIDYVHGQQGLRPVMTLNLPQRRARQLSQAD